MKPFDILGPLPSGTTVLEASAGTGKTFTVGALVARYVAEGVATLPEMLVITFGRAASQELRERVRAQLVEAERALADPESARGQGGLIARLATGADHEIAERRRRVTDALAGFDGATIATTHQFCQLVLTSLGVAGDTDARVKLVENLDDLVDQVSDDLFLERYGNQADEPPFDAATARGIASRVVHDPQAELAPVDAEPGSPIAERVGFGVAVRAELDRRKQRLGILSFDDLLSRLAHALAAAGAPARDRMQHRWKIVLVDEFQDTDPVQWEVLERAFVGAATVVLVGDPKQAIYAFRGGDVVTYLDALESATDIRTLPTNYRSDGPLVDALQVLMHGAELGDPRIAVHPVEAHRSASRLAGLPNPHPVRLRAIRSDDSGSAAGIADLRVRIADDLAADVARLLTSDATFDDGDEVRPVRAGDVAILMQSLKQVGLFRAALRARGIPSVDTSGGSVLVERAGDEWLSLLEALEQQRTLRVRAVALGPFVGHTPASLDAGGDDLTDEIAEQVRGWLDLFRARGIAAVHESITAGGLAERVLSQPDGERLLTDLDHVAEALHDVAHRERLGLPALLEWLRRERRRAARSEERTRRLDTDAAAVQIVSIHRSKGLQWPIVYLPTLFNRWFEDRPQFHRYHDGATRTLDVGGRATDEVRRQARSEDVAEELRLTYVAMTRAQSQVVTWWGASKDASNSGFSRLLLARQPGDSVVPDRVALPSDHELGNTLRRWESAGALHLEVVDEPQAPVQVQPADIGAASADLDVRAFDRAIDTAWRRTSYSGLIRAEVQSREPAVKIEPEVAGTDDEDQPNDDEIASTESAAEPQGPPSPMNDLPAGATFGSLVHGVLEHADPGAPDLVADLREHVAEQLRWWPVDAGVDALAEALAPMQQTSLGPLADGLRLVDIPLTDRLRELDFEFPLVGGDRADRPSGDTALRRVAEVLRRHLPDHDPMLAYAEKLESPALGDQVLRGYLSGSIDVVLRVPDPTAHHRYVVVDYKTNMLGVPDRPLGALDYTPELMTEAMLHSHYPLQALLYSAALHRFLRWRVPDYDPERHLGGVLYLYVRGMCGPETPEIDGQPCGVFAWKPPAAMVVELSALLAGQDVMA